MKWFSRISKPKNSLKVLVRVASLTKMIKEELGFLDWSKHKYSADVIERICNLIESEFCSNSKAESKVDKKQILFDIVGSFIALTEDDKRIIGDVVEHLHNTGRIRLPSVRSQSVALAKCFLKK